MKKSFKLKLLVAILVVSLGLITIPAYIGAVTQNAVYHSHSGNLSVTGAATVAEAVGTPDSGGREISSQRRNGFGGSARDPKSSGCSGVVFFPVGRREPDARGARAVSVEHPDWDPVLEYRPHQYALFFAQSGTVPRAHPSG